MTRVMATSGDARTRYDELMAILNDGKTGKDSFVMLRKYNEDISIQDSIKKVIDIANEMQLTYIELEYFLELVKFTALDSKVQ